MLDMNVTFKDLGLLLVFVVIIAAGVFLIRALVHLGGALRDVKKLIGTNAGEIDKVIKDLPALSSNVVSLTEHASEVTDNLRNEQELIESALANVCDTIESVSDTARIINEDVIGSIRRLLKTLMGILGFVSKKKQPPGGGPAEGVDAERGAPATQSAHDTPHATPHAGDGTDAAAKRDKRERRAKRERVRSAAVAARKRQAEKARNINIHIR
ncbi:MAG: hypothetical protein FWH01_10740 [Oscillospiraceae bacterium]|nr:hypothetical protein [Oscillospiraceae bacterium]